MLFTSNIPLRILSSSAFASRIFLELLFLKLKLTLQAGERLEGDKKRTRITTIEKGHGNKRMPAFEHSY